MKELAREMDGVRGRSRSGVGGARDQPNKEVRMAVSEGWLSDAGDDADELSAGVHMDSSSEIEEFGRAAVDNAERNALIWEEV
jgi:hypothetical protein